MKLLLVFLSLVSLSSCDSPQRTRYITNDISSSTDLGSSSGTSIGSQFSSNTNTTVYNNTQSFDESYKNESGFENCNLNLVRSSTGIGQFGICKHSSLSSVYKVRMVNTVDASNRTCFYPMNTSNGGATMLGDEICQTHVSNQVFTISLSNTLNSSSYINSVMIIKESSLSAIKECLNAGAAIVSAYSPCQQTINNYQNSQYNPTLCQQQINQSVSFVCGSFETYHQNNYEVINF